jgi:hypothetical protein
VSIQDALAHVTGAPPPSLIALPLRFRQRDVR